MKNKIILLNHIKINYKWKKEFLKQEREEFNKINKLKQKINYFEKQGKIIKDKIKVYDVKKEVEIENEDGK